MYIHLGRDYVLNDRDIIGIFNLETTTISPRGREFLNYAQKNGAVVSLSDELPQSYVLADGGVVDTVYLSELSSAVLRRRAEKQQLRVCQKRPEVNHRADADKQQQREKLIRHACVKQCIQHLDRARVRQVAQDAAKAHRQQQRRLHLLADCEINHHAADCPHDNHLHRQLTQIAQNG